MKCGRALHGLLIILGITGLSPPSKVTSNFDIAIVVCVCVILRLNPGLHACACIMTWQIFKNKMNQMHR
jgi:hypothetical protein